MNLELEGQTALITGASRGIGAAVATVLAEEGCRLRLAARSAEQLEQVAAGLRADHGATVTVHVADLTKADDLAALADAAGDADILVNNAGDIPAGPLDALDDAAWRAGWELKVFGYIALTRLVYRSMVERGGGVIVNDIGASGERFEADYIAGSTGNAALTAFTRTLGGRSLKDNVRVVGISPGPVETERIVRLMRGIAFHRFGDEERHTDLTAGFPLGRAAAPREIADAIAFLASPRSGYTSGVVLTVDGGLCAGGAA